MTASMGRTGWARFSARDAWRPPISAQLADDPDKIVAYRTSTRLRRSFAVTNSALLISVGSAHRGERDPERRRRAMATRRRRRAARPIQQLTVPPSTTA